MRKTMTLPDRLKIHFQDYCDGCQMPEYKANIHNDSNGLSSLFCVHSERCYKISQNLKRFYGIDEEDICSRWEEKNQNTDYCMKCGFEVSHYLAVDFDYCPKCRRIMYGKEE